MSEPPNDRTQVNALWNFRKPVSPLSKTIVRVEWIELKKACHTGHPHTESVSAMQASTVTAAAAKARQ